MSVGRDPRYTIAGVAEEIREVIFSQATIAKINIRRQHHTVLKIHDELGWLRDLEAGLLSQAD